MTEYPTVPEILTITEEVFQSQPLVRDHGLLDAAAERPKASMFGAEAYVDVWSKAVALGESISRNHSLVDGNKRTAWSSMRFFLALNDVPMGDFSDDAAESFIIALATGKYAGDLPRAAADLRELLSNPSR